MLKVRKSSGGFTIIELMIATSVLATMLVLVTVLMINVGNLYYKGVNQSRVQGSVRSVTDEVSQQLELSNGFITAPADPVHPTPVQAYCIGTERYTFVPGVQIGHQGGTPPSGSTYYHVLWRDDNPTLGSCDRADLTDQNLDSDDRANHGTELVPPNSTLTAFCVGALAGNNCSIGNASPYTISVAVAYGDHDLLNLNGMDTTCRGGVGDQFCATASLTTVAVQRLTGN